MDEPTPPGDQPPTERVTVSPPAHSDGATPPDQPATTPVKLRVLEPVLPSLKTLIAVAAPLEAEAALVGLGIKHESAREHAQRRWEVQHVGDRFDLIITDIGKANAAAAVALAFNPKQHGAVLNLGIAGVLPGSNIELAQSVIAERSVSADDGMATPRGFVPCARMNFPLGPFPETGVPPDPKLYDALRPICDASAAIATVSTCSGTDAHASGIAGLTGAAIEAMEGAAIGQVAARLGIPFAEIRFTSNTTGDRDRQVWVLEKSLNKLAHTARRL
ncbi:MAG: futalosine hydrolase [Planctomycetota bacterium]